MSILSSQTLNENKPNDHSFHNNRDYKYLRIVAMIYITLLLAATVAAYRVVSIGSIPEPGSTLIYTFSFFWANIFSEVYGSSLAKKLIWESVICGYIFAILVTAVNLLPAPTYWNNKQAYDQVLGHLIRFTNAGVVGYLLSAFLNVYLITKWKYKMKGKYFWIRSLFASSVSESVATFIAGFITFFGMMPTKNILFVMSSAFIFKIIYGFIAVWPASFIAFFLKMKEGDSHSDSIPNSIRFSELNNQYEIV